MPKSPVGLRKCHQLWLLGPSWLIHRKHTGTPSQETLVRSVSQNLSKNFTSLHKKVLSLRLAGEYWSRSKFAARRGGLELELERCSGRAVAIGGSWSDVPVPATEEAPKSRYSTCQHHHHYQHHRWHHHHHPLDND